MKGISIAEKQNFDKLRQATNNIQEHLIKSVSNLNITAVGKTIPIGMLTIVRGTEKVLDTIKLDPKFWEAENCDE